jgi:hypothetical protein
VQQNIKQAVVIIELYTLVCQQTLVNNVSAATSAGGTANQPVPRTQVDDLVSFNGGDATSSGISALSGGDSFKVVLHCSWY